MTLVTTPLSITACYAFVPLEEEKLQMLREELMIFGKQRSMRGLTLVATEGINATVSGSAEAIAAWKNLLTEKCGAITFKDSAVNKEVFKRWSVKIKPEIVGLRNPGIRPSGKHQHVSPEKWHAMLEQEDVVLLDARNSYECGIGKFPGAIDPGTRAFHEFPASVQKAKLPKDKKILLYCTGGIRCEKALLEMESQGYTDVCQLDGGILAYLEKFPDGKFEGECFVFDHRVAVDRNLQPSRIYDLCPHCGDPGDRMIQCPCGTEQKICTACAPEQSRHTCSKRCRNELLKKSSRVSAATA